MLSSKEVEKIDSPLTNSHYKAMHMDENRKKLPAA